MLRFKKGLTATNTAEKSHFLKPTAQSGIGDFDAGDSDNIAESLIIVAFSGS
jgi:hypothetical protein